jgi:hypothetical protein
MVGGKAGRLKVFQARFGFYDSVVAAPSQPAALRAWGTRQNLFAQGQARLATDEAAIKAALEQPGVPLRRPLGSSGPFELEPTTLPRVPDAPRTITLARSAKPNTAPAIERPPADRSALDAAEAALRRLDEARKREEAEFRRRQEELDSARDAAQSAYVDARRAATAEVVEARTAYRKAGGTDQ